MQRIETELANHPLRLHYYRRGLAALEELLADEQPQPVRAAARHHVRHLVDHEHLARAELVCDARRARAAHGLPRAGQVALDAG